MHIKIVAQYRNVGEERRIHRNCGSLWAMAVIYLHYFYGILIVSAIFHINFDGHPIMMGRRTTTKHA